MRSFTSVTILASVATAIVLVSGGCGSDPAIEGTPTLDGGSGSDSGTPSGDSGTDPGATSFTVGGSVTGLVGAGLVLQNNGKDDLAIGADGKFAFAGKIDKGGAFDVTIKSQPAKPNQVCVVTGGKGTIAAGNVSSVVINCTTNQHTVSGSVSGLDGTGLVLTNGGGKDVAVAANGAFSFEPQDDGSAYDVTVKTPPANKSQTCVVTNGKGTIAAADVSNVSVVCTTNKYTVGGSITGLTAGSVVLTNNGADDLTRSANGAFTFATSVVSGGAYAVAVKTQPDALYCYASAASGTVTNANVTNVAVTCIATPASCKAIKAANAAAPSGVYTVNPAGTAYSVYCDMTTDGGGWTLAMKGAAGTTAFVYGAAQWSSAGTLNETSTNLTAEDAKFQAFDDMPCDEVLAQTKNANGDGTIKLANPTAATTLLSVFSGGQVVTNAGRAAWIASQNGTTLQENCNLEGFNVNETYAKARIGMLTNQEGACGSSDSVVGIGVYAATSCGNNAGPFSAGYHSGPACGPHAPVTPPPVAGVGADFWVWIR